MSVRQDIPVDKIIIGKRVRRVLPDRVKALAASIEKNGHDSPIDVLSVGKDEFELITGGHRLDAAKLLKRETITATVFSEDEFASAQAIRLKEIRENMERFELTVLERAVSIAVWRESFEAIHGKAKRGGDRRSQKAKTGRQKATGAAQKGISANMALIDPESELGSVQDQSAKLALLIENNAVSRFASSFSEEAQRVFGLSRRDIFRSLKIAKIPEELRDRIAPHPLADNQKELLLLAVQTEPIQHEICDMVLCERRTANTVSEALAILDRTPKPAPLRAWEKTSQSFSKLKLDDQRRFFELHAEAIQQWLAARTA